MTISTFSEVSTPAPTFASNPCGYIDVVALAASTAEAASVPSGAKSVVFRALDSNGAEAPFWARFDGTAAAIPAADVSDGSAAEPCPVHRSVSGVETISLISPVACFVHLLYFN